MVARGSADVGRRPPVHERRHGSALGADGQLVTFQFTNPGRYLIICMNRFHFLNDWMFGFVNVIGN